MKKIIIFVLLGCFLCFSGFAMDRTPDAVSPGWERNPAIVAETCPTFSWTSVQFVTGYKISVFQGIGHDVSLNYAQMSSQFKPVISKVINGSAYSWTPSQNEELANGLTYVWFVQAVYDYGEGEASKGKIFTVQVPDRYVGLKDKLRDKLRNIGVSDYDIGNVLNELDTEKQDLNINVNTALGLPFTLANKAPVSTDQSFNLSGMKDPTGGNGTENEISTQGSEVGSNTYYGMNIGTSFTSASYNTLMGFNAGVKVTSGYTNTCVGYKAGEDIQSHNYNTFIGGFAGYNSVADGNTFVGLSSGYENTSGTGNTFLGEQSGRESSTGDQNVFIGKNAGYYTSTGSNNTFVGYEAGERNAATDSNTFIGHSAGTTNTGGTYSTFLGYQAGYNNTTGNKNLYFGTFAGVKNTTGSGNMYSGYAAGYSNQTGHFNTICGYQAGRSNAYGGANTIIGSYAGYANIGSNNVFIGYKAGYNEAGSHKLYVENTELADPLIYGEFDNNIVKINGNLGVGNYPGTHRIEVAGGAYCNGSTWVNASSRELKENILSLDAEDSLAALNELEPVKFNYKADKDDPQLGFIAEDVPDLVATKYRKGMNTMDVVALLTKIVQEQQKTISQIKKDLDSVNKKVIELKKK